MSLEIEIINWDFFLHEGRMSEERKTPKKTPSYFKQNILKTF